MSGKLRAAVLAALLGAAHSIALSQSPQSQAAQPQARQSQATLSSGVLSGKLTDLHSAPLDGATLTLFNQTTGVQVQLTTHKGGSFRADGLQPGVYTVDAVSRLGHGHLEDIVISAGHESRIQAAMSFETAPAPSLVSGIAESKPSEPQPISFGKPGIPPAPAPDHETPSVPYELLAGTLPMDPPHPLLLTARPIFKNLAIQPELLAVSAPIPLSSYLSLSLSGQPIPRPVPPFDRLPAPSKSTALTGAEVQSLPAAGRHWQQFALDTPGATSSTTIESSAGQLTSTSVDGLSTRTAFGGQSGSGPQSSGPAANGSGGREQNGLGQAWAGSRGLQVAQAAIHELQTDAGDSERGDARSSASITNITTERGYDGLHGQAFLFDRQNTWGAQNPFTQWVRLTAPATAVTTPVFTAEPYTPPDHETVWGIGAGSQLRRDKLFWFAALDRYSRNDPGLATVKHPDEFFAQPSDDQMQVLSARLGLSSSDPVSAGVQAYSQMLGALDGLLGPAQRTASQWVGFSRVDWQAAERHRITLEAIGAHWNSPGGGLTRVSEAYGSNSFGSSRASEEMLLSRWEAYLTPNLLSVWQGSASRTIQTARPSAPSPFEQAFLAPSVWGQLPQIVVDSRSGFTIGNPSRFGSGSYPDERISQAQESLDWVRGPLLAHAGLAFSHSTDATSLLRNQTGTYTYASIENFASDALVFAAYGLGGELNALNQHNCDQTGKVWRDPSGGLHGLGNLPCYTSFSQEMGPANWRLSTNNWAGFATAQWQPARLLVVSAGLRWERQQLPPPIAALANPELPLAGKLPALGNNWGPRISFALGSAESRLPTLHFGYGMYFGQPENATLEAALTQTGSPAGDLSFFLRPTDNLNAGGAPPFPYVLAGQPGSVVKPGAIEFTSNFRTPEIHQAVAALEQSLPSHISITASAVVSLGRRLPISIDTNFDPALNPGLITYGIVDSSGLGPLKTGQITVPFYASWPSSTSPTGIGGRLNPNYQQITQVMSRANSTYEGAILRVSRYGSRGLSFHAHYTYAHATDWNPNESATIAGSDVLDPADFRQEYGTGNLDIRHSATILAVFDSPWKVPGTAVRVANGWMLSAVGQFRSGMPYTMRTSGYLAEEFNTSSGAAIVALGPGMNGSGGDNRVYGVGRNTYRYSATWKADLRVGKRFQLGRMRELELLAESFNLFNHQNVTELETTGYYIESGTTTGELPTLNFLTGVKANTTAFGQPLNVNATDFYRERELQFGARMRF